jgi:DNA invertase Pin-like site-specific DNA recombinase
MRAALYARVSSERQEKEHTIGSQVNGKESIMRRKVLQSSKDGLTATGCLP